jgi:hypothetical protein
MCSFLPYRAPRRKVAFGSTSPVRRAVRESPLFGAKVVRHGRYFAFQMAEVAVRTPLFATSFGTHRRTAAATGHVAFSLSRHEKPRETCVLMTERFGIPRRATACRSDPNVSTNHGGVSTTFQSCQSIAMGTVSAAIRLSPGECPLRCSAGHLG